MRVVVADALGPAPMPAEVTERLRARLAAALGDRTDPTTGRPDPRQHRAPATRGAPDHPTGDDDHAAADRAVTPPATAGGTSLRDRRSTRPARARHAGVLLAAAAVAGALVALPVLGRPGPGPGPVAETAPEILRAAAAGAVAEGAGRPEGPATDPDRMRACLTTARDPDPAAPLVASRPYPVAGEPGVLLVLGTPGTGRYRVVVVAPGCGRVLAETTVP